MELLAPKAYEKGIDVAWAVDPRLPRPLLGDEVRLRQIVTNLVGNAIKFTDSGGVLVTVGALAGGGRPRRQRDEVGIAITVEDTGIGIAAEALPFLFHEFEQAEDAVRRRQGGTGLGPRHLAAAGARHGRRHPGRQRAGLRLDVHGDPAAASWRRHAIAASRAASRRPRRHHVLLALDRAIERRALRLSLEGAGIPVEDCAVAAAGDAGRGGGRRGRALHHAARRRRAAAVLRPASCWRARARTPAKAACRASSCSIRRPRPDFADFREAGFDAYLVRPVRPQSVLALDRRHASRRQPAAGPASRVARRSSVRRRASVLLVEDNDINALLARRMLEKVGCEVRACVNGREAVDAFRRVLAGSMRPSTSC